MKWDITEPRGGGSIDHQDPPLDPPLGMSVLIVPYPDLLGVLHQHTQRCEI